MTARITPITFPVERQSPMIDGAGTPWVAFQGVRADHSKYTRLEKRTAAGWEHVPCADAEAIYDQPMWLIHLDGTAVVTGMDAGKQHWIAADVPGWTPLPGAAAVRALIEHVTQLNLQADLLTRRLTTTDATITRLTVQLTNALERIQKLEAR